MNKIIKAKKCTECGVLLQSEDPNLTGYIDKEILSNGGLKLLYCNHCFDLKMERSDAFLEPPVNPGFYSIINDAIATDALILYVIDLFNFEDTFNTDLTRTLSDNKANVYIVGAKLDLLPENVDRKHLIATLKKHLKLAKLNYLGIVLTDSLSDNGIDDLDNLVLKERKGRDVYLIGAKYAGKTSLINGYLKRYQNTTTREVTQYNYPGTLLRVTEIPFDHSANTYDTPGLGIENSVLNIVERGVLRYLRPRKRVEPTVTTLYPNNSFIVGGFLRVELVKGKSMPIKAYFSNDLQTKKVIVRKNPDYLDYLIKRNLIKPTSQHLTSDNDFDVYDIILDDDKKEVDISIGGLGWISLTQAGQTIRIYAPRGVSLGIYDTKIKLVS